MSAIFHRGLILTVGEGTVYQRQFSRDPKNRDGRGSEMLPLNNCSKPLRLVSSANFRLLLDKDQESLC